MTATQTLASLAGRVESGRRLREVATPVTFYGSQGIFRDRQRVCILLKNVSKAPTALE